MLFFFIHLAYVKVGFHFKSSSGLVIKVYFTFADKDDYSHLIPMTLSSDSWTEWTRNTTITDLSEKGVHKDAL